MNPRSVSTFFVDPAKRRRRRPASKNPSYATDETARQRDQLGNLIKDLASALNSPEDEIRQIAAHYARAKDTAEEGRLEKVPVADGLSLQAEVYETSSPSRGTIVFVHGFCGNRHENGLFRTLATTAAGSGFDAILYDWRGIGKSQGDFAFATLKDHVEDFIGVAEWARSRSQRADRLFTVGFSLGAAVVGLALNRKIGISSAIYLSPAARPKLSMWPRYRELGILEEIKREGVALKPGTEVRLGLAALEALAETDLGEDAFDIDIPLFVCHGTNDTRIPLTHTEQLLRSVDKPSFKYVPFAGASHSFRPDETYWDVLGAATSLWFRRLDSDDTSVPSPTISPRANSSIFAR